MLTLRPAAERGVASFGWLESRHTFSFGHYYDPAHMGFRALRVINDDRVAPGGGFPTHPHRDAEILSYVVDGALEHRDSMGNGSVIRPGELQRMSAGSGVAHSEFNHSKREPVRFLQIWLLPRSRGIQPGYEQRAFPAGERRGALRLVASPEGRDGSLTIHAEAELWAGLVGAGEALSHALAPDRHAWVQVVRGRVRLRAGERALELGEGDGVAVSGEPQLTLEGVGDEAELLVFDLA
ncbi:MAG: pirin family protein [Myxococcales bacterium]|nr:pirin family protein [Myxococcales bacterium]